MTGGGAIEVGLLGERDTAQWDAFVRARPDGSFFHLAGWQSVINRAFGHRTYFLKAERGGEIVGVLPLVHIRSRLFGSSLVSNAFCVYGGPIGTDPEVVAALDHEAVRLAGTLGVGHLEYRLRRPLHGSGAGWISRDDLYVTFRKSITGDDDANLKAIPRKQRAVVRKAISLGLRSTVVEDADAVYGIYAESVRNLGTPVFPRRYFRELRATFGEDCHLVVITTHEDEPVAACLSFFFRDEILPYYGGGTAKARLVGGNDFLYWEIMRLAAARGVRLFDFGRSKIGTGAYNFKRYWGFEPEPLYYESRLVRAASLPETNPNNPKYRRAIDLWSKLPLFVANSIGPLISRDLG